MTAHNPRLEPILNKFVTDLEALFIHEVEGFAREIRGNLQASLGVRERTAQGGSKSIPAVTPRSLVAVPGRRVSAGDIEIDLVERAAYLPKKGAMVPVTLGPLGTRLLAFLAEHCDETVPRETLIALAWGEGAKDRENGLDVALMRLRRKLGQHGNRLVTYPRVGVCLRSAA